MKLQTPLPLDVSQKFYRQHAELIWGNIPLDASWATGTQAWVTYMENLITL